MLAEIVDGTGSVSGAAGSASGAASSKEVGDLRREVTKLTEENNMLKYKMEVLIDMLAVAELDRKKMEEKLERRKRSDASK